MPILIVIVILVTGLVVGLKRADTRRKDEAAAKQAELQRQHAQKEREAAQRVTAEIDRMESAVSDFADLSSGQSLCWYASAAKTRSRYSVAGGQA